MLVASLLRLLAQGDLGADAGRLALGLRTTVFISVATFLMGSAIALPVAIAGLHARQWFGFPARRFADVFRYTPLIAQLYLVYYGAGQFSQELQSLHLWWLFREPLGCVLLVFTLNTAAYQAYVLAGAIAALPREQTDAALSLGLSQRVILFKVLLPQALIVALRPLGNEFTKMIKASSIASVVTIYDLFGTSKVIYGETFAFDVYIVAGLLYIGLIALSGRAVDRLVRHFAKHRVKAV